jgi:uncharacterized membrane protein
MQASPLHFLPLAWPFFLALAVFLALVMGLIQVQVLSYAYERIGIDRRYVFLILVVSLLGSYINIPIAQLPPERVVSNEQVVYFGMRYVVPVVEDWPRTIIALNVGGAIVPTILSVYLLVTKRILVQAAIGTAIVAACVYPLARPTPGIGIAVPTLVPPLVSALVALLISRRSAPALAYIAGSLGTLIGADLLNLGRIQGLGAPIASIGGAGTFDGIFLSGVLAVLLA